MKKVLILFMLLITVQSFSQNKNGAKILTPEAKAKIEKFKRFDPSQCSSYLLEALPSSVDNTKSKYFPPIINQEGNSCGSASNIHYIYTYEVNRLLDRSGSELSNISSYMNAWNHLNGGVGEGVFAFDIYDFVKTNGNVVESDFQTLSHTEWPNGYPIYKNGMQYRIEEYYTLEADIPEDFMAMKTYLADGGVMEFEANTSQMQELPYMGNSELGYKYIIPMYSSEGMHAMTIAGYDDTVWYDYNSDGKKDDFEMGAFLCVNSWGEKWGDKGRFYTPYHAFTTLKQAIGDYEVKEGEGGTGNGGMKLSYIVKPMIVSPKLVVKLLMSHTSRNDMRFTIRENGGKEVNVKFMQRQGGDYSLCNSEKSKEIMEFGIDISELVSVGKESYELKIINNPNKEKGEGKLLYCSLLDYSNDNNNPKEYLADYQTSELSGKSEIVANIKLSEPEYLEGQNTILKHKIVENNILYLYYFSKEESYTRVEILDAQRNQLDLIYDNYIPAGSFSQSVNISKLGKGNYILKVIAENNVIYKTFKN